MSEFSAATLSLLVADHPDLAIEIIAAEVAAKHARKPEHLRIKILRRWIDNALREGTYRRDQPQVEKPGMFRADGSWSFDGIGDPAFHQLISMLATATRRGYDTIQIATRILAEPDQRPFPNSDDWLIPRPDGTPKFWSECHTTTSAEQCIKDGGLMAGGEAKLRDDNMF